MIRISETTAFHIFLDFLGMTKIGAKWVPRMIIYRSKTTFDLNAAKILKLCDDGVDPSDITGIVTGDALV